MASKLIQVEFEVFGKVQGVFFRKYTQEKCVELDINGWCMNTPRNTVQGVLEGVVDKVNEMKKWLKEEGSPRSKITNVVFSNEKPIEKYSFTCFAIRG